MPIKRTIFSLNRWVLNTPARALEEAYQAAQRIRNIELQRFDGKKISIDSVKYTKNVISYWQGLLNQNLATIKIKLAEFRLSRSLLNVSDPVFLNKLKFIDEIISKYRQKVTSINQTSAKLTRKDININTNISDIDIMKVKPVADKSGLFPRSIGRSLNKIRDELSANAENRFFQNFQISSARTKISLRFLVTLIIAPLLTYFLSQQLIFNPLVEKIRGENPQIFLNSEMQIEALQEFRMFKGKIAFENLITDSVLSPEVFQEQVKERAIEIATDFEYKSNIAISNILASFVSLITFAFVIAVSKKEIEILKSFMDDLVYGLSDSAKAFLIILFTDMFVGFHSPHGWEVLLEKLAHHLGLPANHNLIFLFIATFPVILDTIFKYWIFRYLSRISPSALATYKEMNDA